MMEVRPWEVDGKATLSDGRPWEVDGKAMLNEESKALRSGW